MGAQRRAERVVVDSRARSATGTTACASSGIALTGWAIKSPAEKARISAEFQGVDTLAGSGRSRPSRVDLAARGASAPTARLAGGFGQGRSGTQPRRRAGRRWRVVIEASAWASS